MIDTFEPLEPGPDAARVEREGYAATWSDRDASASRNEKEAGMKLASLRNGRDGELVVVSRDLSRAVRATEIAPTLQAALDEWTDRAPSLHELFEALEAGSARHAFDLEVDQLAAPIPRAFQWLDASAYVNHVELVRKARGAEMPSKFWTDPLMYQGGSDTLLSATDPILTEDEAWGIDFEAEVAVLTDDVESGASPEETAGHIRLLMLVNDVSLRNLIPGELAKGFGFVHGKPPTACSPVAITPDELGEAWSDGRVHRPLEVTLGEEPFGSPNAGQDMTFNFPTLLAHAAKTRPLGAGTILGSGTVSNLDRSRGSCCLAEKRMLETLDLGEPKTPFLKFGDRVRIAMHHRSGQNLFGTIDQRVKKLR